VLKIFVNGQLQGQDPPYNTTVCVNNDPLIVGATVKREEINFVDGRLDDVRVYNNALSASQIREVMLQP
jgi:hypothetical protein